MSILHKFIPLLGPRIKPLLFIFWRFARGMTLGVRCAVLNDKNQVFLVRHTYTPGWHFPGGGVEVGETTYQALEKELYEEGLIKLTKPALLSGLFFNNKGGGRDHVVFYIAKNWQQSAQPQANHEIAETGFFDLENLPPDTTPATLRRLNELQQKTLPDDFW